MVYFADEKKLRFSTEAVWWAQLLKIVFGLAAVLLVVDGYIARKYNQITKLGRILDPLADKFMVWSALISLSVVKIVPRIVTILYFIKEMLMGIGGLLVWRRTKDMPPSQ